MDMKGYIAYCALILMVIIMAVTTVYRLRKMSKEERLEAILKIVKTQLLKFMGEAEVQWEAYKKSGALKKSQVIQKIYEQFPLLKEYIDQDTLIQKISDMIEDEMENLNKVLGNK